MTTIRLAHLRVGGSNVAIFDARPLHDSDGARRALLGDLSVRARLARLRVDHAVLAYMQHSRLTYFGEPAVTSHLRGKTFNWTHTITV